MFLNMAGTEFMSRTIIGLNWYWPGGCWNGAGTVVTAPDTVFLGGGLACTTGSTNSDESCASFDSDRVLRVEVRRGLGLGFGLGDGADLVSIVEAAESTEAELLQASGRATVGSVKPKKSSAPDGAAASSFGDNRPKESQRCCEGVSLFTWE